MSSEQPAIIQGDRTVLLEVEHARYDEAREILGRFAELERSPEHVHTYRLSALALWNAAALGVALVAEDSATPRAPRTPWIPGPADEVPAGHLPCPCGSGQRFRSCCRPALRN